MEKPVVVSDLSAKENGTARTYHTRLAEGLFASKLSLRVERPDAEELRRLLRSPSILVGLGEGSAHKLTLRETPDTASGRRILLDKIQRKKQQDIDEISTVIYLRNDATADTVRKRLAEYLVHLDRTVKPLKEQIL
jgi:hypothetical protein